MTTTIARPRRITTFQYARAAIAVRLGLEPEHEGATPEWAELLRGGLTDRPAVSRADVTATAVIPAVGRSLAAIAAVPYREVVDEHLGTLRVATQEPARLFDARRYAQIGGR